jgi:serine/threonine protein kinase
MNAPSGAMDALAGAVLDRKYRLEQPLGRGGMGAVFLATHLGTERPVALKVIAPEHAARPEFLERFRREARSLGRLRHPGVVDVTDFGVAEHTGQALPYLVMELLDGVSLAEVVGEPQPLSFVVEVVDQVASALQEAHAAGIVHRDLKPENLWLEPDRRGGFRVKVLDFGLARLAGDDESRPAAPAAPVTLATGDTPGLADQATLLAPRPQAPADLEDRETLVRSGSESGGMTRLGSLLGTPAYMSPEQAKGLPPTPASDLYSLGVLCWRLLAGRPPFAGSIDEVLRQHREAPAPSLRAVRREVPKAVDELLSQALDKDPARRPVSAAAFAAALRARAESGPAFVQRVFGLLATSPGPFLRVSLLAHAPMLSLAAGLLLLALPAAMGAPLPVQRPHAGLAFMALIVTWMAAIAANGALCEPLIAQLLVAPLRPPRLDLLFQGARSRAGAYGRTLAGYLGSVAVIVAPALVPIPRGHPARYAVLALTVAYLIWIVSVYDRYMFTAQVVVMEGLERSAARERSRVLAREAHSRLKHLETAGTLPVVFASTIVAVAGMTVLGRVHRELGLLVALGLFALGFVAFSVFVAPVLSASLALLYFRVRESLGEPLGDILERYERVALPETAWPRRLRDRLVQDITVARTRGGP